MLDIVELSRLQFALTAMYHFLFVPLTLGMAFLLAIMETQLSMGRIDDAGHSLQRLRAQGQGSAELRQGLLLWEVYAGERQDELREARLLAAAAAESAAEPARGGRATLVLLRRPANLAG